MGHSLLKSCRDQKLPNIFKNFDFVVLVMGSKKKKKVDLGPFSEDEIEEVRKKVPKKGKRDKHGLFPEPWLDAQPYEQDKYDEKSKKDAEREKKVMYDDYYDDYYESTDDF